MDKNQIFIGLCNDTIDYKEEQPIIMNCFMKKKLDIYLKLVFIIDFIGQHFVMKTRCNRVLSKKCQRGWIKNMK